MKKTYATCECLEYSLDRGWDSSENFENEWESDSLEDYIKSIKSMDVFEVYEKVGDDYYMMEVVDRTPSIECFKYQLECEYGQYMLSKGVYHVNYIDKAYHSKGELLKKIEYSSFKTHVVDVFETDLEALNFMKLNNVKTSVVSRELYHRKCSITGEGMNEGYVIGDGELHIKGHQAMLNHITNDTEYATIEEAYDDDYYYYTEWDDDDYEYEMAEGRLIEL